LGVLRCKTPSKAIKPRHPCRLKQNGILTVFTLTLSWSPCGGYVSGQKGNIC
jgi:hypothetical protein